MWRRSYRNHVIMAFPSFDTVTNSWAPQADISWCAGSDRYSEFVRFQNRLMTENEAVNFALQRSVSWIKRHLKHMHAGAQAAHRDSAKSIAALKDELKRASWRSQPRPQAPALRTPVSILTYNQFKALVAKLGVNDNEHSLHKSYAALIKLRKTRHCSWAEIREKVKHSQEMPTATKHPPRGMKKSRLPLTPKAWQSIG